MTTWHCDHFHFQITLMLTEILFNSVCHQLKPTQCRKSKWQWIWKNLCNMKRSPTIATSAATPALHLLFSNSTCGNTQEKSLSNAINVVILAKQKVTSRYTWGLIQMKSLSAAHNVVTPANRLSISKPTCWHILGEIPSTAHNVTTPRKRVPI